MKGWHALLLWSAALPAWAGAPQVFPSGASVPENLLRIELRLERPLAGTLDMRRVQLLDEADQPIADALLDLPLPSTDGRGLTLLLHPGRIKSGLGPQMALGTALRQGRRVTLAIDDPLAGIALRKSWQVTAAQGGAIVPLSWEVAAPRTGSRAPLLVRPQAALDAGAAQLIAVADAHGLRVPGRATLDRGELAWRFTPQARWRAGTYQLRLHPALEDPQGNRLCSAFEQAGQSALPCQDGASIPFTIR